MQHRLQRMPRKEGGALWRDLRERAAWDTRREDNAVSHRDSAMSSWFFSLWAGGDARILRVRGSCTLKYVWRHAWGVNAEDASGQEAGHSLRKESLMPRIIVTTEGSTRPDEPVLLDEWVHPQHLQDDHSAEQLIERIGWAVNDADDLERRHAELVASG